MPIKTIIAIVSASLFAGACVSSESIDSTDDTSTVSSDLDHQPVCSPTHEKLVYRQFCRLVNQTQGAQTCTDHLTIDWAPQFTDPNAPLCVEVDETVDSHVCTTCAPGPL
jgi:hypothetical protein